MIDTWFLRNVDCWWTHFDVICFKFVTVPHTSKICKKCECHSLRGIYTHAFLERDTILFDTLKQLKPDFLIKYYNQDFLMPTTKKQKKTTKSTSRGLEMLSDIENLDIMLGGNHFERKESEDSNLARRRERISCNASENNEEILYSNPSENRSSSNSAALGKNSAGTTSSAELKKLSGEPNSRISREMDEMNSAMFRSRGHLMMPLAIRYFLKSKMPLRPDQDM